jgi:hypothetical protein
MTRAAMAVVAVIWASGCSTTTCPCEDAAVDAAVDAPPANGTIIITVIEPDAGPRDAS